jgi:hypothetical protein
MSHAVESYAKQLRDLHTTDVETILAKGALLNEAKRMLSHGEWGQLCERLPFGVRSAHRYRAVAAHVVLSDRTHVSDLPADVLSLYVLSRVAPARLEAAIKDGTITAKTTRAEARAFAGGVASAPSRGRAPKPWTVRRAIKAIGRIADQVPVSLQPELGRQLRNIAAVYDPAGSEWAKSASSFSGRRGAAPDRATVNAVINDALRTSALKHHPDKGGDPETMKRVNAAIEWLRAQAAKLR